MSDQLRQALAKHASSLSQRVLDDMYENPYWMERYGDRGRRYANEDSLHHISYLDQALSSADPQVFERYAHWLRSVLVSRGMCSVHLGENFQRLARAIVEERLPDAALAVDILVRGDRALDYTAGEAGRLFREQDRLLEAVKKARGAETMREDDQRYLVSYLIDAHATGEWSFYDSFASRFPPAVKDALNGAASAPTVR